MRNGPWQVGLLILIGLAGCRGGDAEGGNGAAGTSGQATDGAVQTSTLTGLYESGTGPRRNQMCMVEREGRPATFGFVVWGPGETSCSGSGPATREGDRLTLRLDGDESCALAAQTDGRRVTLPARIPEACSYYCGEGARMAGATFDKVGGSQADAMRAEDLVGDPLCGG